MKDQVNELLLQALETEMGGVQIYQSALGCVRNAGLKKEWEEYLEQTRRHVVVVTELCEKLGADPNEETPGRKVVRHIGESLVKAIQMAQKTGEPDAAQLVACECVVLAETKDHANWGLLSELAKNSKGKFSQALEDACREVEVQEDEHLYHTMGWARELWISSLGMKAVLPPPEEEKDVKTAIGAARAAHARKSML